MGRGQGDNSCSRGDPSGRKQAIPQGAHSGSHSRKISLDGIKPFPLQELMRQQKKLGSRIGFHVHLRGRFATPLPACLFEQLPQECRAD
jgi:hypothetical protein